MIKLFSPFSDFGVQKGKSRGKNIKKVLKEQVFRMIP